LAFGLAVVEIKAEADSDACLYFGIFRKINLDIGRTPPNACMRLQVDPLAQPALPLYKNQWANYSDN
jgi:hypothetical protein